MNQPSLIEGADGRQRCFWCGESELYQKYHDEEWGRPQHDDQRLFEKLCLEGFQAGLSWITILKKRENFRRAFHDFEIERVARFTEKRVEKLLLDPGIIRHRGKIEATIQNARAAKLLQKEFGSLDRFFWQFVPPASERPKKLTRKQLGQLGKTKTSEQLSKELRKRGFRFVGPTTAYAFMQAMGLVNDHLDGCEFSNIK